MHTYKIVPENNTKIRIRAKIENTRKHEKNTCYVPSCCNQLKPAKKGGFTQSGFYDTQQICQNPNCKNYGKQTRLAKGVLETADKDGKVKVLPPTEKRRSKDREDTMTIGQSQPLSIDHDFVMENDGLYEMTGDNDPNFDIFRRNIQGRMIKADYEMQANPKRGWIYGHNGKVYLAPVQDIELNEKKKESLKNKAVSCTTEIIETNAKPTIKEEELAKALAI